MLRKNSTLKYGIKCVCCCLKNIQTRELVDNVPRKKQFADKNECIIRWNESFCICYCPSANQIEVSVDLPAFHRESHKRSEFVGDVAVFFFRASPILTSLWSTSRPSDLRLSFSSLKSYICNSHLIVSINAVIMQKHWRSVREKCSEYF